MTIISCDAEFLNDELEIVIKQMPSKFEKIVWIFLVLSIIVLAIFFVAQFRKNGTVAILVGTELKKTSVILGVLVVVIALLLTCIWWICNENTECSNVTFKKFGITISKVFGTVIILIIGVVSKEIYDLGVLARVGLRLNGQLKINDLSQLCWKQDNNTWPPIRNGQNDLITITKSLTE